MAIAHKSGTSRNAIASLLIGALALVVGCCIAWMDTRPGWDDTGITAGALLLGGLLAAVLGLRWWIAVLLVAGPIILAECQSAGWAVLLMLGFAVVGSALGAALRAMIRKR